MPLPADMGMCVRKLRKEKPEMKSDQRVAICLDTMRRAGKDVGKPNDKPKEGD